MVQLQATEELRKQLKKRGFNRDVEIPEEVWNSVLEEEHRSSRSLASLEHRNEPTFRDDRSRDSIELKNYSNREMNGEFVAELEHFNPEKRPLMHVLVDFPLWIWRNRIKHRGPELEGLK